MLGRADADACRAVVRSCEGILVILDRVPAYGRDAEPHSSRTRPASTSQRRVVRTASSIRRSWVTSSSVPEGVERLLELLDGGQVEVVGRLVEHQQVDPARLQQRQRGPGALAG